MHLETSQQTVATVVRVAATTLDADSTERFRSAMAEILENASNVVLDLAHLEFIDSSGLGAILSCLRDVAAEGGELKLCGLSGTVRAVFDLARVHRVLDIHDGLTEALEAFPDRAA